MNGLVKSERETTAKIQEVKNVCSCDKVDIVAHSMGGLVTREYVARDDYGNDIDQLIFLAISFNKKVSRSIDMPFLSLVAIVFLLCVMAS